MDLVNTFTDFERNILRTMVITLYRKYMQELEKSYLSRLSNVFELSNITSFADECCLLLNKIEDGGDISENEIDIIEELVEKSILSTKRGIKFCNIINEEVKVENILERHNKMLSVFDSIKEKLNQRRLVGNL